MKKLRISVKGIQRALVRRHRSVPRATNLLIAMLAAFAGCGSGERHREAPAAPSVSTTTREGPVVVTLSASSGEVDLFSPVEVDFEIVAEKGVTIAVENYGRALREDDGRFDYRISRLSKQLARPTDDNRLRWTYGYELTFVLPGEYELPPARLTYVDERPGGDERQGDESSESETPQIDVETEPLRIVVHQPPDMELSEEDLMTVTTLEPVELPSKWSRWWWLGPLLVLGGLVVVWVTTIAARRFFPRLYRLLLRLRRLLPGRRTPGIEIPLPPHEWARRQIAALVAEDLLGKGRIQEFYYRITDIVRGYVERRFSISAPEMTTEEFLAAALPDRRFGAENASALGPFLTACDQVKYARHDPKQAESDSVLRAAGDFIERTRDRELTLSDETAGAAATEEQAA